MRLNNLLKIIQLIIDAIVQWTLYEYLEIQFSEEDLFKNLSLLYIIDIFNIFVVIKYIAIIIYIKHVCSVII